MKDSSWHYPKIDPTDIPEPNSTILLAEYFPARPLGFKGKDGYSKPYYRVTMYDVIDPKIILHWATQGQTYAWQYFEIPPLKK